MSCFEHHGFTIPC